MTGVEATSAFAGDPQPVEVFHRGIWYSGELLGWRHDPDGGCRARVRCVVNGLRQSAWMDLGDLRLPRPVVAEDGPAPAAAGQHSRPPIEPPHPRAAGRRDAPPAALPPPLRADRAPAQRRLRWESSSPVPAR
jgi:hypothetical protein